MSDSLLLHILDRFRIHFVDVGNIILAGTYALRYIKRRTQTPFLPETLLATLVLAGIAVSAFACLREAFDVHAGQPLVKAVTDYVSWFAGAGATVYLLYRLK